MHGQALETPVLTMSGDERVDGGQVGDRPLDDSGGEGHDVLAGICGVLAEVDADGLCRGDAADFPEIEGVQRAASRARCLDRRRVQASRA